MAFTRYLTVTCVCGESPAKLELFNRFGVPQGKYCYPCAKLLYVKLQAREDAERQAEAQMARSLVKVLKHK